MFVVAAQPPDAWTGPQVWTLVTAVIALVLALGSLGWQITAWILSGPRITVTAFEFTSGDHEYPIIHIQAMNTGRAAALVGLYGLEAPNDELLAVGPCDHDHVLHPHGGTGGADIEIYQLATYCTELKIKPEQLKPWASSGKRRYTGTWGSSLHLVHRAIAKAKTATSDEPSEPAEG